MKIQSEERLAATSERNRASSLVTGCDEARRKGAAAQVKRLSHELFIVPEADVVHVTEGSTLVAVSPTWTWQGDENLTDQLMVTVKRGNARGGKGLAVEPLGQGHIHRTKRRVRDGNKT